MRTWADTQKDTTRGQSIPTEETVDAGHDDDLIGRVDNAHRECLRVGTRIDILLRWTERTAKR